MFALQTGIVVDSLGNLLVSDFKNNVIPTCPLASPAYRFRHKHSLEQVIRKLVIEKGYATLNVSPSWSCPLTFWSNGRCDCDCGALVLHRVSPTPDAP